MKPSARIQACIDILSLEHSARVPLDSVVGDYMRSRRYIGSKDRSEIAERLYNITRAHGRLDWWCTRVQCTNTPRMRVLLWLRLGENLDMKRVEDLCDGTRYSLDVLTQEELSLLDQISAPLTVPEMPEDVRAECPAAHYEPLKALFGDQFMTAMEAMQQPATLDLRINSFLCNREGAQKSLAADDIDTIPTPFSPWGLRCKTKSYLAKSKAFAKGWVDIQDEGSQLIAFLAGAQPGMQVLDYCAGAGGKTLALAAAMLRKGRIVAMDTDENRLQKGRLRFKKAQLADIIEVRPLTDEKNRKWLRRQKETFDVVLLDVPCSGTGTWRRNPDARWRNFGPPLPELLQTQAEILEKTASVVKSGGRLVYATCSLLPAENEDQITKFLATHPEFEILPPPIAALSQNSPEGYMRLFPHTHQTDGFFAAILTRK